MTRKKYNPELKRRQQIISALKNYVIIYFVNADKPDNEIGLYDLKGNAIPVTMAMARIIETYKHKWSVMLAVFYKEKGVGNCSMRIAEPERAAKQSELVVDLNAKHQDFITSKRCMGVIVDGVGWIASPVGLDLDEQVCGDLFSDLGAF